MKFDIVIGNPPYQNSNGGGTVVEKSDSIYGYFVQMGKDTCKKCMCLLIPARWYLGETGVDNLTKESLTTGRHLTNIVDYNNSWDIFDNVSIASGICYMTYVPDYVGPCTIKHYCTMDTSYEFQTDFNDTDGMVFRHSVLSSILTKIKDTDKGLSEYSELVSPTSVFGLDTGIWREAYETKDNIHTIPVKTSQGTYYVEADRVTGGFDILNNYKLVTGSKSPDRGGCKNVRGWNVLNEMQILEPRDTATQTYLVIGNSSDRDTVERMLKYMKTKFARFMVLNMLSATTVSSRVFKLLPIQDFTEDSEINWNNTVNEINKQLYDKYKLSDEEIEYIELEIKEMK